MEARDNNATALTPILCHSESKFLSRDSTVVVSIPHRFSDPSKGDIYMSDLVICVLSIFSRKLVLEVGRAVLGRHVREAQMRWILGPPERRDCFLGKFVIPRGFRSKSAHLFAQVFPRKIRLLMESPWNGEAAPHSRTTCCQRALNWPSKWHPSCNFLTFSSYWGYSNTWDPSDLAKHLL